MLRSATTSSLSPSRRPSSAENSSATPGHGQIAGIAQLQGNAVAKPCPPAEFSTAVARLPSPQRWEQLDLGDLTVAGQPILGKTTDQVRAILGPPTLIRPRAQAENGVDIPEYRYGGTTQATLGLSVTFVKKGKKILANSLYYQAPSLVDAKLGHVLRLQPTELQQLIGKDYGSRYRLYSGYGYSGYGASQISCSGTFRDRTSAAGINFGLNPFRPSRPYLEIRANGGS